MKIRDRYQCQACGDRFGDPYCILHVHHIVPRPQRGADDESNLITLCELCHAVVWCQWHKCWFPVGTAGELQNNRVNYEWFLLPKDRRDQVNNYWRRSAAAQVLRKRLGNSSAAELQ